MYVDVDIEFIWNEPLFSKYQILGMYRSNGFKSVWDFGR